MNTDTVNGHCACKNVLFEIPYEVNGMIYCHCNMCRDVFGSDYTTWLGIDKQRFRIVSGDENLSAYKVSARTTNYFCQKCGTHVYAYDTEYDHIVGVRRALVKGDVSKQASGHYFVDDKAPWHQITDTLPQFGGVDGHEPKSRVGGLG